MDSPVPPFLRKALLGSVTYHSPLLATASCSGMDRARVYALQWALGCRVKVYWLKPLIEIDVTNPAWRCSHQWLCWETAALSGVADRGSWRAAVSQTRAEWACPHQLISTQARVPSTSLFTLYPLLKLHSWFNLWVKEHWLLSVTVPLLPAAFRHQEICLL